MNTIPTPQTLNPSTQPSRRSQGRRLIGGLIVLLVIIVAFLAVMMWRMNYVPADLDTATTRASELGIFDGAYTPKLNPLQINQIHAWTFHLTTPDDQSLEGAQIKVDGGMPRHGHGLPTSPQVTQDLGNGDYLVEGLKFHMPGWWVVNFHITANGKSDTVTFNLIVK